MSKGRINQKEIMGLEADKLNSIEINLGFPEPGRGGRPISPIRKRGVYRARKRGEAWADDRIVGVCIDDNVQEGRMYMMGSYGTNP